MKADTFKNHVLFEKLDQLFQRLGEEEARQKIDIENYSFFDTSAKYISDRIKLTIPILVQEAEMNALVSEVDAALQQINAYLGNNNVGHLTNANNNFYSAVNRIRNFPLPFSKSDINFSKIIADFQDTVSGKYRELESENTSLKESINTFQNDLAEKELELQRIFKILASKETEIQNLNLTFQTEFNNIKVNANQEYEIERKNFRSEFDEEKAKLTAEIKAIKKAIDSDTTDLIQKLNTKLTEANNIVNVIGNVGVTGNYQLIANENRTSANFWRIVAIIFMTTFSGLLVWTIFDLSNEGFNWTKSLIRLVAAAALSYPATYAARESSRHRKLETFNRTAELELASINPFIELLPEEKKQIIKEKLVDKYFGNSNTKDGYVELKDDEEVSIGGFEKILKAVAPLLKK